ncbi:DUF1795 domain-containing protein [Affinibrenneria salicis]|uniref:DUF1795 domain-containing protein n=1 Tax=Affinibrenneria salicis TaxID=2590031 RepID=A0A5J5G7M8_9GAMM|nr:DcrB-related protein [Affinibrenneria salicis]KAA9002454.1 DUF1795 domain-containing protein [Affinibrenneria salicis]KAA9003258.1 DUF1795 domain-containing protein [Affinibrenneria salicis]
MNQQTEYILSEGRLTLPEAVQDQSVTILKLPHAGASLVITRAWDVPAGQEEQYLRQQLVKVKRDMRKFIAQDPLDAQLGELPAREVDFRFENQSVQIYQKLLVTRLDGHLLAMALSRCAPFDEAALALWQSIKTGFAAHPPKDA